MSSNEGFDDANRSTDGTCDVEWEGFDSIKFLEVLGGCGVGSDVVCNGLPLLCNEEIL